MPEYTFEELRKKYQHLPPDLQEALFAVETADSITKIGTKFNLNPEQITKMAHCIGWVMYGVLPPKEFSKTLETELKFKPEIAKKIAEDIDREMFSHLRISLSKIYSK